MILQAEGIGHPSFPLHAVFERNPPQIALPVVSPAMVDASEILFAFTVGIETDERPTMRAPILERINLTVVIPRDNDRGVADFSGAKIAGLGQLHLKRQIVPGRALEDALLL